MNQLDRRGSRRDLSSRARLVALCGGLVLLVSLPSHAGGRSSTFAPTPNDSAAALARASLHALGGPDILGGASGLRLRFTGVRHWDGQGRSPAAPVGAHTFTVDEVIVAGVGVFQHYEQFDGEENDWCVEVRATMDRAYQYDCLAHVLRPLRGPPSGVVRATSGRYVHSLIGGLLRPDARVASRGSVKRNGRALALLEEIPISGPARTWSFDAESKLPESVTWPSPTALGDTVSVTASYADYRKVGAVMIPHVTRTQRPADLSEERRIVSVEITSQLPASRLDQPGVHMADSLSGAAIRIQTVDTGTLLIENVVPTYNTLVTATDDGIVVFDAPGGMATTAVTLGVIAERFPGRTVTYVVPTHFHYDHVGGIVEFVRRGAQVLTTAGNVDFFNALLTRRLGEEAPATSARPRVRAIKNGAVIGRGTQRVELRVVDGAPHVSEMILPYLPASRTMYVSDLVLTEPSGLVRPASDAQLRFAETFRNLGLPVDRFALAHGTVVSAAVLDSSVAITRALRSQSIRSALEALSVHTVVMPANAFALAVLVETARNVVVVDAGISAADAATIRARAARIGKPIAAVLVTHAHIDHYGGAFELRRDGFPVITGGGVARQIAEYDSINYARFGRAVPSGSRVPDRILGDGDTLMVDGVRFTMRHLGPGESYSDVWWHVQSGEREAAIIGDVAMFGLPPLLQSGHSADWLRSLQIIKRSLKDSARIYIGHDVKAVGVDEHSWDAGILDWQAARLRRFREEVARITGGERLLTTAEVVRVVSAMNADAPDTPRSFNFIITSSANVLAAELIAERQKDDFERQIKALFARPRNAVPSPALGSDDVGEEPSLVPGDSLAARLMAAFGNRDVWANAAVDHIVAIVEPPGGEAFLIELWTRWDRPGTISWVRARTREQLRIFDGERGWTATRVRGEAAVVREWSPERLAAEKASYRTQAERTIRRIAMRDPALSFATAGAPHAGWLEVRDREGWVIKVELGPDGAPVRVLRSDEANPIQFGALVSFGNHKQPASGVTGTGEKFTTYVAELLPSADGIHFGPPRDLHNLNPKR